MTDTTRLEQRIAELEQKLAAAEARSTAERHAERLGKAPSGTTAQPTRKAPK